MGMEEKKKKKKKSSSRIRITRGPVKLTGLQKIYKFLLFIFLVWSFLVIFDLVHDPMYAYFKGEWYAYEQELRDRGDYVQLQKHHEYYLRRHPNG